MPGQLSRGFPLFPLGIVALPTESVPLHIFESRYRTMIELCLQAELGSPGREFGIVWLSDEELKLVGCACEIEHVLERLEDGRLNILTRGRRPFRLVALGSDRARAGPRALQREGQVRLERGRTERVPYSLIATPPRRGSPAPLICVPRRSAA